MVDAREVPLSDVFALEEVAVDVLALVSTVGVVAAVEALDSADVDVTAEAPDVTLVLADTRAEVDDAGDDTPAVDDAVSSALPVVGAAPDPAPEDDPAVFDVTPDEELPVADDWI